MNAVFFSSLSCECACVYYEYTAGRRGCTATQSEQTIRELGHAYCACATRVFPEKTGVSCCVFLGSWYSFLDMAFVARRRRSHKSLRVSGPLSFSDPLSDRSVGFVSLQVTGSSQRRVSNGVSDARAIS